MSDMASDIHIKPLTPKLWDDVVVVLGGGRCVCGSMHGREVQPDDIASPLE